MGSEFFEKDGRLYLRDSTDRVFAQFKSDGSVLDAAGNPVGGMRKVADVQLSADTATLNIPGLSLAGSILVTVIAKLKLTGVATPNYGHIFAQFNGDTAQRSYMWTVKNSDDSTNTSTPISTDANQPAVQNNNSLLVGHAPTTNAAEANMWGTIIMHLLFPGDTDNVKTVQVVNQAATTFVPPYTDLKPIEMHGPGFWVGPGAITSINLIPELNQMKSGSRAVVLVAA